MRQRLIKVEKLSKLFYDHRLETQVLHDISMEVYEGDMVAIVGASGSGKSTLLSILGLLETFHIGHYELCGEPVYTLSDEQMATLRAQHIGWVFQQFLLLSDMTVLENVMMPLTNHKGMTRRQRIEKAQEKLTLVGMHDKVRLYPSQLSGGQQQRVAIARALVAEPELILADEPTGNLDSVNSQKIFELLQTLNSQGRTVLLVTHSKSLAEQCRKRYLMVDGVLLDTSE
ncbi:ABC transporter ATP-binding protein [Vibrio profundi]|uniref:ABC transporter ATP-binding protein n=1 Tax=Vibrio profundi TaxID=1774960 RepID=UPI0037365E20